MTAHTGSRLAWLALTPEPERELPEAVALLRRATGTRSAEPPGASETRKVQQLVLRGTDRAWRRYLHEISELAHLVADQVAETGTVDQADQALASAALLVGEVILEHHRMLIGLPGAGYRETEQDRKALAGTVARLSAWLSARASQATGPTQEGGS